MRRWSNGVVEYWSIVKRGAMYCKALGVNFNFFYVSDCMA